MVFSGTMKDWIINECDVIHLQRESICCQASYHFYLLRNITFKTVLFINTKTKEEKQFTKHYYTKTYISLKKSLMQIEHLR